MAIDIGTDGGNRAGVADMAHSYISYENVANDTGFINHIEVYRGANVISTDLKVGVFYVTVGTSYICRNVVTLTLTGSDGDKNEFDAPDDFTTFAVTAGDFIGCYGATIEVRAGTGSSGEARHIINTDATDGETHDFDQYDSNLDIALYATGFVPGSIGGSIHLSIDMKL